MWRNINKLLRSAGVMLAVKGDPADAHATDKRSESLERSEPGTERIFRAGAHAIDVTPRKFPVIVNGFFWERTADSATDPVFARCLVLDDGSTRIAIGVVDSCMLPRDLLDEAKRLAQRATGIPIDHMLIAATHNHSAPSAMGCLGSDADQDYVQFLPGQIARGIELANDNLAPARVGWAVAQAREYTHNRRWFLRPDRLRYDPFGHRTVCANLHPGHQNPDFIGPSGPVDPDVSMLSVQATSGRPIALLANYAMHHHASSPISGDFCGRFGAEFGRLAGVQSAAPPFVGIVSQATSGDASYQDYSQPTSCTDFVAYAKAVAQVSHESYQIIEYHDWAPLVMREERLVLRRRIPDRRRLAWAREIVAGMKGHKPLNLPEVYAREQLLIHENPTCELKLQAIRIGALALAALPNEVFALTGLKIKAQSPLQPTFTIELANGAEGYIPPPEQYYFGGYTTWPARTAGLEVEAEPKIVETVLRMLEEVSGKRRRKPVDPRGPYAETVLASKPRAYWRMNEMSGPRAIDHSGNGRHGIYEEGVAFYLPGPDQPAFCDQGRIGRAVQFAGGRMKAALENVGQSYSLEMWFWNGMTTDARDITGCLYSSNRNDAFNASGDSLCVGGITSAVGRLVFSIGVRAQRILVGNTKLQEKTWCHIVLVRDGSRVTAYLNGNTKPELYGEVAAGQSTGLMRFFFGGGDDSLARFWEGPANFEGRICEISFYDRVLTAEEIGRHYIVATDVRTGRCSYLS